MLDFVLLDSVYHTHLGIQALRSNNVYLLSKISYLKKDLLKKINLLHQINIQKHL